MGRGPKPAKGKAKPAVSRKSQENEDSKVRDLEKRLAEARQREADALKRESEALERQTATAEVLRIISGAPTDLQPVFDAILDGVVRFFRPWSVNVCRFDGELIHLAATFDGPSEAGRSIRDRFPTRPTAGLTVGRCILNRAVIEIHDVETDADLVAATREMARVRGWRSALVVPMLRDGNPIGAISVSRREPGPFSEAQTRLLTTFADQAVIAIENVRLFTELQEKNRALTQAHEQISEAFERQTATAVILGVISRSPTDVQPVFDAIVESAVRLCDGVFGTLFQFDGELIHQVAQHNYTAEALEGARRLYPCRPSRAHGSARAILERAVVHIPDNELDPEFRVQALSRAVGWRSGLFVPMLREGAPIGVIAVSRAVPGPFSDNEIELLKTFADQAVIAIENVRLFTELQEKNRALTAAHAQVTESLEQQTATAEILQAIAHTPTDTQPVFDAIARSASRLCHAAFAGVFVTDGRMIDLPANYGTSPEGLAAARKWYPRPLDIETTAGVAILTRSVVHVPDTEESSVSEWVRHIGRLIGFRSMVTVPMLRGTGAVGAISVDRQEPGKFSDAEVRLLQTFADQAVIAIENVRLFRELEARNRDLTEALDQQTATSEILRVISSSPTDLEPVFKSLVASAARLCQAQFCHVLRFDGSLLHMAAHHGFSPEGAVALQSVYPSAPGRGSVAGRSIFSGRIEQIPDINADADHSHTRIAAIIKAQSIVAVPMLRDGMPIGSIVAGRSNTGFFPERLVTLLQTFADQAVIAIENVRLFTELQEKNRALTQAHAQVTEALDQKTATSEILRVISSSPTDVLPVFEAITDSAMRLFSAWAAAVFRYEGQLISMAAARGGLPGSVDAVMAHLQVPHAPTEERPEGRTALTRTIQHVVDVDNDMSWGPRYREDARARGFRSYVAVPMLRGDVVVGVITVSRQRVGGFAPGEISLLQTFADQAVIAIENVRLFNETKEALEQQTATSEILRVISSSPTDVQPVFEAIVRGASGLLGGLDCIAVRFDGTLMHLLARHNPRAGTRDALTQLYPQPPTRTLSMGRVILDKTIVHIPDVREDAAFDQRYAELIRLRGVLAVPIKRDDSVIGGISVSRSTPGHFSDRQIALLQTFADQAVIAIENVRLFTELQASNRELTTALDTQTATSDILRVISGSRTDVQPVFDTIVQSAVRLLRADVSVLTRVAGNQLGLAALTHTGGDAAVRAVFPLPLDSEWPHVRSVRDRVPLNIVDTETDPRIPESLRAVARARGFRGLVTVPLLQREEALGAIAVARREAGGFTDDEIALLQTFADQAVIAIENARLLSELQARTQELTRSVEQLTALGDVGRAVSSSLDLDTVLTTIVGRAIQLSGTDGGTIFEYVEATEEFVARATVNADEGQSALLRATRLRRGEGAVGQLAVAREPIQMPDIAAEGAYASRLRGALLAAGTRSVLAVPLLHEERLVGGLVVTRRAPGTFTTEVIELLKTFATQSALAIQNARLFREIADKSRQLEVASQHKSEFLANMSHELRTPLNAIIGFSEVLTERMFGELNEKQDEYLKDIYASGTHLLSLINDILDLSKIEAGRMELELSDFDLPTALDNALTLVRERAGRRSITLRMNVDERLGEVRADERKIRQVVLNLLSNAIKFTPEGGRIEVAVMPRDRLVEVSVSDTGVGIAPEHQEAVFEEFRQVGTADKKAEGTGLGLTLCRKFIELHGGRIWVKSQLGVGSTFTFTIPVRRGE